MKQLSVNVPTGGKVIITRPQKKGDPNQQILFNGSYKERWQEKMVELIRQMPKPLAMSDVRVEAGKREMDAPFHQNWYGSLPKMAGLRKTGRYQASKIKSRNHGLEAVWA